MTAGKAFAALTVALVAIGCKDKAPASPPAKGAAMPAATGSGSGAPDDCQTYVDKARPVIREMTAKRGMKFGDEEATAFVRECRTSADKEPLFRCVVAAADEAAVRACYAQGSAAP